MTKIPNTSALSLYYISNDVRVSYVPLSRCVIFVDYMSIAKSSIGCANSYTIPYYRDTQVWDITSATCMIRHTVMQFFILVKKIVAKHSYYVM